MSPEEIQQTLDSIKKTVETMPDCDALKAYVDLLVKGLLEKQLHAIEDQVKQVAQLTNPATLLANLAAAMVKQQAALILQAKDMVKLIDDVNVIVREKQISFPNCSIV